MQKWLLGIVACLLSAGVIGVMNGGPMTTQEEVRGRANRFVPSDRPASLADIRRLHAEDVELLFQLCTVGVPAGSAPSVFGLQSLARTLAILARDGFEVISRAGQHVAEGTRGGYIVLDDSTADKEFLEHLYAGGHRDKSLKGVEVSRDRLDFYLAEFPWEESIRRTGDKRRFLHGRVVVPFESLASMKQTIGTGSDL